MHVAALLWVHQPHETEQLPQAEYPQFPVSQAQADQLGTDQEFATQDEPFREYPLSQERDSDDALSEPASHLTVMLEYPFAKGLETDTVAPSAIPGTAYPK